MGGRYTAMVDLPIALAAVTLLVISSSTCLPQNALASQSISLGSAIENYTQNLMDQIRELANEAANSNSSSGGSTMSIVNATDTNASSLVSNRIVVSQNDSSTKNAGVSTQISTINGVCTSNIIGGSGDETLSSNGVCSDQLTGGAGADTFVCGKGNDLVRDYNSTEGDRLMDEANCETVL
jgi:Ca2+-binding RTX toxin-like protein